MDIILKIWAEVNNKGIFLVKIIKCLYVKWRHCCELWLMLLMTKMMKKIKFSFCVSEFIISTMLGEMKVLYKW